MTRKAWTKTPTTAAMGTALALLVSAAIPLSAADHWEPFCPHSSPHAHTYALGSAVGARSAQVTGGEEVGFGVVTVTDTNVLDCNGDGVPGDFDGDWDAGVGGAFYGFGPWAHEATCDYGLTSHGGVFTVNDLVFGSDIWFVIGADDTSGPTVTVDPSSGEPTCTTDGSITPCDDPSDPTCDPDDCLTQPYHSSGATCGAGGDGGYWVFLTGVTVEEGTGSSATVDGELTELVNELGGISLFCPPCPPGQNCCTANCLGGLFCCTIVCPPGSVPDCQCNLGGARCVCVNVKNNPPTSGNGGA